MCELALLRNTEIINQVAQMLFVIYLFSCSFSQPITRHLTTIHEREPTTLRHAYIA